MYTLYDAWKDHPDQFINWNKFKLEDLMSRKRKNKMNEQVQNIPQQAPQPVQVDEHGNPIVPAVVQTEEHTGEAEKKEPTVH
jgi:hypothetical protein